jgi:hypothetical protein
MGVVRDLRKWIGDMKARMHMSVQSRRKKARWNMKTMTPNV